MIQRKPTFLPNVLNQHLFNNFKHTSIPVDCSWVERVNLECLCAEDQVLELIPSLDARKAKSNCSKHTYQSHWVGNRGLLASKSFKNCFLVSCLDFLEEVHLGFSQFSGYSVPSKSVWWETLLTVTALYLAWHCNYVSRFWVWLWVFGLWI